jgi:hypothetical protein
MPIGSLFHWTENRVRGHIAIRVLAAVIEAVIANDLTTAQIHDPNLDGQTITPRRAPAELNRIRTHHLSAGERNITVTTRRNGLQAAILAALDVNTHNWDNTNMGYDEVWRRILNELTSWAAEECPV